MGIMEVVTLNAKKLGLTESQASLIVLVAAHIKEHNMPWTEESIEKAFVAVIEQERKLMLEIKENKTPRAKKFRIDLANQVYDEIKAQEKKL
jgi:hypothetical protein